MTGVVGGGEGWAMVEVRKDEEDAGRLSPREVTHFR